MNKKISKYNNFEKRLEKISELEIEFENKILELEEKEILEFEKKIFELEEKEILEPNYFKAFLLHIRGFDKNE